MKSQIKYIELKTGFSDNGPAWIATVEFSKSGQTIYFNNSALKKLKRPGIFANYFDIKTGDEYWISGVKKNGQDRHWAGSGKIMIDKDIIDDYLSLVDFDIIEKKYFEIINVNKNIDKLEFENIENAKGRISDSKPNEYYRWYWDNNRKKLIKE